MKIPLVLSSVIVPVSDPSNALSPPAKFSVGLCWVRSWSWPPDVGPATDFLLVEFSQAQLLVSCCWSRHFHIAGLADYSALQRGVCSIVLLVLHRNCCLLQQTNKLTD